MTKVVVLLGIVLFVLFSGPVYATECGSVDESTVLEQGHRAYALLAALQAKEPGMKALPICVFGTDTSDTKSGAEVCCYPYTDPVIAMSRYTLEHFSDTALSGALAHEVAHVIRKSPPTTTSHESELEEEATDALAIELTGTEVLRAAYVAHTNNTALADRRVRRALKFLPAVVVAKGR